jgi:hypothetical protein
MGSSGLIDPKAYRADAGDNNRKPRVAMQR